MLITVSIGSIELLEDIKKWFYVFCADFFVRSFAPRYISGSQFKGAAPSNPLLTLMYCSLGGGGNVIQKDEAKIVLRLMRRRKQDAELSTSTKKRMTRNRRRSQVRHSKRHRTHHLELLRENQRQRDKRQSAPRQRKRKRKIRRMRSDKRRRPAYPDINMQLLHETFTSRAETTDEE